MESNTTESYTATVPELQVSPGPQPSPEPAETRFLKSILFGPNGLRVGWSVVLFLVLAFVCMAILGIAARLLLHNLLHVKTGEMTPLTAVIQESIQFLGLLGAAAVSALIEKRRIVDYNLAGANRLRHFAVGLVGGFLAISALVGVLHAGGWLQFGAVSLSGVAILQFGAVWGVAFLLTGFGEEGMVRCYMLFTLTRGINYWWALGTVSAFSLFAFLNTHGSGGGGVYLMAALGVGPCLLLHRWRAESAGFWEAAWLTSTFFGYIHTFNKGETWIGIFSAAAIGFVFCVSVRLTGSVWWAIGFHAAWDWGQTFFYGTADSGMQAKGHYLTTLPVGSEFWSGGSDGPEGSVLILPTVLLVLILLVLAYGLLGRTKQPTLQSSSAA
jgi:membrane protease YdiL (CAAX protease family)